MSSLMPLDRFREALALRGVEIVRDAPDPAEHPYAGRCLTLRGPFRSARHLREIVSDAKLAALRAGLMAGEVRA